MKKYFISLFLFLFSIIVSAQSYTPMLELNKTWNMYHYDAYIPESDYGFNITLDYTTIINGKTYFHASNGDLFREDITNKKVYKLVNNVDELILDFDLAIGDELISPLVYIAGFSKNITTIGTAEFYGIPNLKYYETDCGEKIIEGIGVFRKGLFYVSNWCSPLDYYVYNDMINLNYLAIGNYFIQNNITLFYNSKSKNLELINGNTNISISLFSILGKKVLQTKFKKTVSVSHLKKGIYFYQLSTDNASKKGKILVY